MKFARLLYLCLAITLFFTACKKSEDTSPAKAITGKWREAKRITYELQNNVPINSDTVLINTDDDYFIFNADKQGEYSKRNSAGVLKVGFEYSFIDNDSIRLAYPGTGVTEDLDIITVSSTDLTLRHTGRTGTGFSTTILDIYFVK